MQWQGTDGKTKYGVPMTSPREKSRTRKVSALMLVVGVIGVIVSFGVTSRWGFPASASELCRSSSYGSGLLEEAGWAWIPFPVASCKTVDFDSVAEYFALGWENSITAAVSIAVIAMALKLTWGAGVQ